MIYLSYYLTYPEEGSEMNDAVKVGIAVGAVALVAIGLGKMSKARLRLKICAGHKNHMDSVQEQFDAWRRTSVQEHNDIHQRHHQAMTSM